MTEYDEILDAFEKALELERELGTRTVECDRALLTPMRAEVKTPPPPAPATKTVEPARTPPRPNAVGGGTPVRTGAVAGTPVKPSGPLVDFAFVIVRRPEGEAANMLAKMVAAMGYTLAQVAVVEAAAAAAAKPRAKVYVVLGSDAFKVFAPGQRAALGMWTAVAEIPTVVTYSPTRILSYFGNDPDGLLKAKRQIWSDLKSALARIGKVPRHA